MSLYCVCTNIWYLDPNWKDFFFLLLHAFFSSIIACLLFSNYFLLSYMLNWINMSIAWLIYIILTLPFIICFFLLLANLVRVFKEHTYLYLSCSPSFGLIHNWLNQSWVVLDFAWNILRWFMKCWFRVLKCAICFRNYLNLRRTLYFLHYKARDFDHN